MTERNPQAERKSRPAEQRRKVDMSGAAVEERWNKTWQLTVEAWAKKGIDVTQQPMRRDVVRLIRLKDKQ